MSVDPKVLEALDLRKLPPQPGIRIDRLEAEDYTDWGGDPALRILAVLDEAMDVENVSGEAVGNFTEAIRDSLRNHGVTLFPYIFYAKPSELKNGDEE